MTNALYYGDNLAVLRESITTDTVDLKAALGQQPAVRSIRCPSSRTARCVCACAGAAIFLLATVGAAAAETKRVLMLYSFDRDVKPWSAYDKNIRAELEQQSRWLLEISDHSLITPDEASEAAFVEYLRALHANRFTAMAKRPAARKSKPGKRTPERPVPRHAARKAQTVRRGKQPAAAPPGAGGASQSASVRPTAGPPAASASATQSRKILAPPPPNRRLQIFATDPGSSRRLKTAFLNTATAEVPWETAPDSRSLLQPGPVGEYLEVVDVDPASGVAYEPVDLNHPFLLAQDGLPPSEGNPQFHQQMVYAVAMQTIRHFEQALGRRVLWAPRRIAQGQPVSADSASVAQTAAREAYVRRLRIYPHGLRQANAYYSPQKAALLFGYFPAGDGSRRLVFTSLSHDIIAHETTHALLDGLHRRYQEPTNRDVLAFHEAFADIVAIFQHFTFPELLRFQIEQAHGDLRKGKLLAELAQEFGHTLGRTDALRSAVGTPPSPGDYAAATEPHDLGTVLVSAVFDAFLAIYARRVEDLLRIASGGSGILGAGALHPDLVGRLADEATRAARHVLTICIRALDYMPPVDPTFPEYLRALITADSDLVANDRYGYRVAFLEAFGNRGIIPNELHTLSVGSLRWQTLEEAAQPTGLGNFIRKEINISGDVQSDRYQSYLAARVNARKLHDWLDKELQPGIARALGLDRELAGPDKPDGYVGRRDCNGRPRFEVHSVRPARRSSPDGDIRTDIIAVITQHRDVTDDAGAVYTFRGGCTLVLDRREGMPPIRYSITKPVYSDADAKRVRNYQQTGLDLDLNALYFEDSQSEPFALLHSKF